MIDLDSMSDDDKLAALESIHKSISESKEIQKQKIAANVNLVLQSLKKMESDIRARYDETGKVIEKRVANIKDGRDGRNGVDGKPGRDGRNGKDGATGPRGLDGLNGSNGIDGEDGVSVSNAHIDFDGSLIITLSDGRELNVGEVVSQDVVEKLKIVTSGGAGGAGGSGTVSSVATGTGLTGGPITTTGTVALANTAVTPGSYTAANITVDAQGRLTSAANGSAGSGTVTSVAVSGGTTGLTTSGGPITTSGTVTLAGTLAVASGGTGTGSPSIVAGTNVTVTGTWPNQTIASSGGGIAYTVVKTANYTAANNDGVLTNTTGGAFTVTLPTSPSVGNIIVVVDSFSQWGTNNLTVDPTASIKIAGNTAGDTLVCDITGATVTLVYTGATYGWNVSAQVGGNGGTAVTLTGTQTLTNKTISGASNTLSNIPLSTGVTGTLPVANGGTGETSYTNGQLLIGNTTGNTLTKATLTAGTGVTITNGNGAITIATSGGAGDVVGPASSTANGIALFDGTTGKLLKNSSSTDGLINGLTVGKGLLSKSNNTAFGVNSLAAIDTGNSCTAIGRDTLPSNTTASNNTAIGNQALLSMVNGANNTAIGHNALVSADTGTNNVACGASSLQSLTSGRGNTSLNPRTATGTYAPIFDPTTEDNRFCMGSTAVTNAYIQVAWTVVSDIRDKTDIATVPHGLNFISQIEPIAYRYKVSREAQEGHGPLRYGFKAQQILEIEKASSLPVIVDDEDENKLRLNDQSLIAVMVNAIKELNQKVELLSAEIATLKGN